MPHPLYVLLATSLALLGAERFTPPDRDARMKALGDIDALDAVSRRAFDPGEPGAPGAFMPIPRPEPSDWLDSHHEDGQTFEQFARERRNVPTPRRRTIYFLPLGTFREGESPKLETLREIAAAFFGLPVKMLPSEDIEKGGLTKRIHPQSRKLQLLTGDVLAHLKKRLPKDAYCLLGITMTDLYPDPSWNFVFGVASLRSRVGVYSFARLDPVFLDGTRGAGYEELLLRRSAKVLVHETAHMFGAKHCIYFSCILNGSNHLEEADSRELRLCPICLRKLRHAIGFDLVKRYQSLHEAYEKAKLEGEAAWAKMRARHCAGVGGSR